MMILAFDTSVTGCSVCVTDGQKAWTETMATERGQAEFLVPMIEDAIQKSGHGYKDLDRIVVTIGPGSFTGVRVGLSTAKALALSLNKPLVGISTLDVIARGAKLTCDTLVLIDTKRGDFYGQVFDATGRPQDEARIWSVEEVAKSGLQKIENAHPDVEILARMAAEITPNGAGYDPLQAPNPLYLRGAEVSQSKRALPKIVKKLDGAGGVV